MMVFAAAFWAPVSSSSRPAVRTRGWLKGEATYGLELRLGGLGSVFRGALALGLGFGSVAHGWVRSAMVYSERCGEFW